MTNLFSKAVKFSSQPFHITVSLKEKILFCKHLAIAIKSGMSLLDSLRMLRNQKHKKSFYKVIDTLIVDVTSGIFLSKSLEKFSATFGPLFINVIKIAETSGTLPENLNYLAQELQKRQELVGKIRGAMIYPIIIFFVTIIIATGMVVFVFPKLLPLFSSLHVELPLTTRMLIALTRFLSAFGLWVLLGLVIAAINGYLLVRLKTIKHLLHRLLLRLPIFGEIAVYVNLVTISRTIGLLLKSGIQIIDAINITANVVSNLVYREKLAEAAEQVRKGEFISKYFTSRPKYFPSIFSNMVEVGENTGNLSENFNYLGGYYEAEVDDFVKNLSSIVEPIMLVFMGVIVGFIALSFITPLYKLTQGLR